MNLFDQLQTIRISQFNQAQLPNTGLLSPRKGFITITRIDYEKFGEEQVAVATINWKRTEADMFLAGMKFRVALRSLFHSESTSKFKNSPIEDLVGKYLYINNIGHVLEVRNKGMIKMNWGVIEKELTFITEQTAGVHLFFGSAKTLTEAWSNFEKTASYDVAEALEFEANGDADGYVEDFDNDDAPDAPDDEAVFQ